MSICSALDKMLRILHANSKHEKRFWKVSAAYELHNGILRKHKLQDEQQVKNNTTDVSTQRK